MTADNATSDLSVLNLAATVGYLRWPIPHKRDVEIARVVNRLAQDIEQDRPQTPLKPDQGQALAVFAERMASLAVRDQDPEHLRRGLLALGLAASARTTSVRRSS